MDSTEFAPEAGDVAERGALFELAFLADDAREARQLLLLARVELDHVVEGVGDLAAKAWPIERQPDGSIALLDRQQRIEQRDGVAVERSVVGTVAARCMPVLARICAWATPLGYLIEDFCQFPGRASPMLGQADGMVTVTKRLQAMQDSVQLVAAGRLNDGQDPSPPKSGQVWNTEPGNTRA